MNINISLIGQMLTFSVLVWFTMRFVWPPITVAMEARRQKIADGLAAAEQGEHKLQLAQEKAKEIMQQAKQEAVELVEQHEKRCNQMIDEAKQDAKAEAERIMQAAQAEVGRLYREAKVSLKNDMANQVVRMTERVLAQQLDAKMREDFLETALKEVQ